MRCSSLLSSRRHTVAAAAVVFVLVLVDRPAAVDGQFFNALRNLFRPVENIFRPVANIFGGGGRFTDDGTQSPQATGKDELFPRDCGRDTNKGTGKLCFPDGLLCQDSKFFVYCFPQLILSVVEH
jgi:hypothetical protein